MGRSGGTVSSFASSSAISTQTTDYTLVITDAGKLVTVSKGSAAALTVPAAADVAFTIPTTILVAQLGAGLVTLTAAGGVTIRKARTLALVGQYGVATLILIGADLWIATGDLT